MNEWIEIAKAHGLAGLVILALGAFMYFKVWPLFTKRLEDADKMAADHAKRQEEQAKLFAESLQAQREADARRADEQGKIFSETMRTAQVLYTESHKEIMQALKSPMRRKRS